MSIGYPSDISCEQFALIFPILEGARHKTKPRVVDLYDIFCGICYVLKSGCQWRMLPPAGRRSQKNTLHGSIAIFTSANGSAKEPMRMAVKQTASLRNALKKIVGFGRDKTMVGQRTPVF